MVCLRSLLQFCVLSGSLALLDINVVKTAFNSPDGLVLRIADPGERSSTKPKSTTVWRKDLPLAFYAPPRESLPDTAGIMFEPGTTHALCGYSVDGNTIVRVALNDSETPDPCGVMGPKWAAFAKGNMSGKCNFTSPGDFAPAYFYKPMVSIKFLPEVPPFWALEYNTCHFEGISETLDAQKALLTAMMKQPPGMTLQESVGNASKLGAGLTAFNEVVVSPYASPAVGGVFWAHPGPFRAPIVGDTGACRIANYLKTANGSEPFPIFELAGANIERPFLGCHAAPPPDDPFHPHPALDCISKGLAEWQGNLTDGGRDPATVFRTVASKVFLDLLQPGGACAGLHRTRVSHADVEQTIIV